MEGNASCCLLETTALFYFNFRINSSYKAFCILCAHHFPQVRKQYHLVSSLKEAQETQNIFPPHFQYDGFASILVTIKTAKSKFRVKQVLASIQLPIKCIQFLLGAGQTSEHLIRWSRMVSVTVFFSYTIKGLPGNHRFLTQESLKDSRIYKQTKRLNSRDPNILLRCEYM